MKSVLLGGKAVLKVYPPQRLVALKTEAGLHPVPLTKEEILANPAQTRNTEYIFSTWGMPAFSAEEIDLCFPQLKAVFYSAGTVQHFARPFLEKGIRVFSAWGANAVPVAEYTVAQILLANKGYFSLCRKTTSLENRALTKAMLSNFPGNYGCKVGILGAGMIGRLVIKLLKPFDLEILVYDPYLSDDTAKALGVTKTDLQTVFEQCQTVSNHVANLPATQGMLHGELFAKMPPNATFINTGRGAQVVEEDLIAFLKSRPDVTALLDVTWPEPAEEGSPFYSLPNVFLTPHIAGSSGDEVQRMSAYMLEEYRKYSRGEACEYEVSLKMLETMA